MCSSRPRGLDTDAILPSGDELDRLLDVACQVALVCGRLIVEDRPARVEFTTKSTEVDVVTVMDRRSEELAHAALRRLRPDDGIVGEEGLDHRGTGPISWLVDPIDGTVNYLYDHGHYAVSVAAVVGDPRVDGGFWPVAGAVLNPALGDLYRARRGGGAELVRGDVTRLLRATPATGLGLSLVGTGFGYDPGTRGRQGEAVARLLPQVRDIRRLGAGSLDLCSVAAGRLDAYYESGLHPWDHAAAWVVVEEAGLTIRGEAGGPPTRTMTMAGRPEILDAIAAIIV